MPAKNQGRISKMINKCSDYLFTIVLFSIHLIMAPCNVNNPNQSVVNDECT